MPMAIIHYALLIELLIVGSSSLVAQVTSFSTSTLLLQGDWSTANRALQDPNCCVVSVSGLDSHLEGLQKEIVDNGMVDLDLRSRIRTAQRHSNDDCRRVLNSVVMSNTNNKKHNESNGSIDDQAYVDPCTAALDELARGMALLAPDGLLRRQGGVNAMLDVHMRIVCASEYRAVDPMFHTDKCPLRGYVTLRGVGTEYMSRPCSPVEYLSLRTLGKQPSGEPSNSLRQAKELEFIVMKGDYYPQQQQAAATLLSRVWQRTFACAHRSPPGNGGRRIIISLDLTDGMDDREWYDAGQKREWRSGMTQRKSRLVA